MTTVIENMSQKVIAFDANYAIILQNSQVVRLINLPMNVKEKGAYGNGIADDYNAFLSAIAALPDGGDLYFPRGSYILNSSITFPENITLIFEKGAMLSPLLGKTVTINGNVIAEVQQIFAGAGTIAGSIKAPFIYAHWWGAKGDGVNDDYAAIQAGVNYLGNNGGGKLTLPKGDYKSTGTILMMDWVALVGEEVFGGTSTSYPTRIEYYGTGSAIQTYKPGTPYVGGYSGVVLKNLYVTDVNGTGDKGFDLEGFQWCKAENIAVYGFNKGYYTKHSWYGTHKNILVANSRQYGFYAESNDNNALYEKCKTANMATGALFGAYFGYASNLQLSNFASETNTEGIKLDNCFAVLVNGFYYETFGTPTSAILLTSCKGTTIVSPYINGNSATNRGVNSVTSVNTVIIGGTIVSCTNVVIDDNAQRNSIILINVDHDKTLLSTHGGSIQMGKRQINYGIYNAVPATGTWNVGDIVYYTAPVAGGYIGAICITAGTPGTWKGFGLIQA